MTETHKAIRATISAIADLAEVVKELDPGSTNAYERIAKSLEAARGHMTRAEAYELAGT